MFIDMVLSSTLMLLAVVVPSLLMVMALPLMATLGAAGMLRSRVEPSSTTPPVLQSDPLQVEPLLLAQTVTSLRRVSASLRANCRAPSRLLAAEVLRLDAMLL